MIKQHEPYVEDGYVVMCHKDLSKGADAIWETQSVRLSEPNPWVKEWQETGYTSLCIYRTRQSGHGTKDQVLGTRWVHVDLDVYKKRYTTKEEAIEALLSYSPKPSVIIDSGGGLYGWWRLDELCTDHASVEGASRYLSGHFKYYGADNGWNINHVFRYPGSYNMKDGSRRPVKIIYESDAVYPISAFYKAASNKEERYPIDIGRLADNWEQKIKSTSVHLWERISSNKWCRPDKDGHIDRSENDWSICIQLMQPPFLWTDKEIAALLTHHSLFSGEKYRDPLSGGWNYVETTICNARAEVEAKRLLSDSDPRALMLDSKFSPAKARDAFLNKMHIRRTGTKLRYFDGEMYEDVQKDYFVEKVLSTAMGDLYRSNMSIEVKAQLLSHAPTAEDQGADYIAVENGLVNLHTYELSDFTPDVFVTAKLPVRYDTPRPDALAELDTFVEQVLGADNVPLWWQFVGGCFPKEVVSVGFLYLYGLPGTGKSQIFNLLQCLLGENNYSTEELQTFADRNFGTGNLRDMLANINAETTSGELLSKTSLIKKISAGDKLTTEMKYEQSEKSTITTTLFFADNHRIKVKKDDEGWYRRLYSIPCRNRWPDGGPDTIRNIGKKLGTRPDILTAALYRALEGLKSLRETGYIDTDDTRESRDETRIASDHVLRFWKNSVVADPEYRENSQHLFGVYYKLTGGEGSRPSGKQDFMSRTRELMDMGIIPKYELKQGVDSRLKKNSSTWFGCRIIEPHLSMTSENGNKLSIYNPPMIDREN